MSTIATLLQQSIHRFADRAALTTGEQTITYRELGAAADRLVQALAGAGVLPGERVAVIAPNSACAVVAMFAAWWTGAVAVPLNARWREYDLGRALRDAEPSIVLAVRSHLGYSLADLLSQLRAQLPRLRRCFFLDASGAIESELAGGGAADSERLGPDIGLILYTSGTTGAPKGALIRHAAELRGVDAMNERLGAGEADVCVFVVPVSHAFGLSCLLGALAAGSRCIMVESSLSSASMLEAIERHRATVLHGSPTIFAALLKAAARPLGRLRTGFVAGAPCPPQVIEELDRRGIRVLNLYGMTELGAAACVRRHDALDVRYHTVGRPLPGFEVRIDARTGGELLVRGPDVTPGYFRRPDETAQAFEDGWFRTGDIATIDEDGNLSIAGRAKELVKVSGLNVFPAEVEGLLLTHPDVLQAAVVGVPHEVTGEALHAFVVAREGRPLTPAALLQYARPRIAGYKLPYAIHLLPEMPVLASGKPDRVTLRRRLQGAAAPTVRGH